MAHLIDKDALVTEIERRTDELWALIPDGEKVIGDKHTKEDAFNLGKYIALESLDKFIDTLEVKEVDLMIHTIIAECCNWLAVHTELNHEQIEDCRNLMLTVKDEQLKAKQG